MSRLKFWDGTTWQYMPVGGPDPSGATSGQVWTANGSGGAAWAAPTGGSGNVATDAIFDAKGDLVVGTANNTAARLAVGTNNQILVADSATATGLKWAAAPAGGSVATDTIFDAKGDLPVGTANDTAAKLGVGTAGQVLAVDSSTATGLKWVTPVFSSETRYTLEGALAPHTGSLRLYNHSGANRNITNIAASVGVAPATSSIILDAKVNGTSIYTSGARPTIAVGTYTDASSAPDVNNGLWANGNYITIDVVQTGSTTTPGGDLSLVISWT